MYKKFLFQLFLRPLYFLGELRPPMEHTGHHEHTEERGLATSQAGGNKGKGGGALD